MRILVATSHEGIVGGTETYLRQLLAAWHSRGITFALLADYPPSHGTRSILPDDPTILRCHLHAESLIDIQEKLVSFDADLCFMHGLEHPEIEEQICNQFRTIFFAHNHYGMCISGTRRFRFPQAKSCSRIFGPACLGYYLPRRCGGFNPITAIQLYQRGRYQRSNLDRFDRIVVASEYMKQQLIQHRIDPTKIENLPLFLDPTLIDEAAPSPRPFTNQIMLIGRLTELKGIHFVLKAIPEVEDRLGRSLRWCIAGEGPEKNRLMRLAKTIPAQIEFLGWIEERERQNRLRDSDLLVVSSTWPEPFGLVGIEAAAVGVPTAAFAVGGIPEWCRHGETGALAPGELPRVSELASAIVYALENADRHEQLRTQAWKMAQSYSIESHLNTLQRISQELVTSAIAS